MLDGKSMMTAPLITVSQPKRVTSPRQSALQTLWSATITVPMTKVIKPVTHRSPLLLAKSVITALKYDLLKSVIPTTQRALPISTASVLAIFIFSSIEPPYRRRRHGECHHPVSPVDEAEGHCPSAAHAPSAAAPPARWRAR